MGEIDDCKLTPAESISAACLNEKIADVHFICKNKDGSTSRLPAHKQYLALVCPTFYIQFFGSMPDQNEVKVDDYGLTTDVFTLFLHYLYNSSVKLDREHVWALLYLGNKYLLKPLKELCTEFIIGQLQQYSPWCIKLLQQLHGSLCDRDSVMLERVLKLIDENGERAVTSKLFLDLNEDVLTLLLQRDTLDVHEVTLYRKVVQWSEMECERTGMPVTLDNQQEVLQNILPLIRFTTVTRDEFQLMMRVCRILSEAVIAHIVNGEGESKLPFCTQPRTVPEHQIYIIGGIVDTSPIRAVHTYCLTTGSTLIPLTLNTQREAHCAAYSHTMKQLFVLGGWDSSISEWPSPEICSFGSSDAQFMWIEPTRIERLGAACICLGSDLYVVGGANKPPVTLGIGTCEKFNIKMGRWTDVASLPLDVDATTCVLYEDGEQVSILLVGGVSEDENHTTTLLKKVYEYLPGSDQWRERVDLELPTGLCETAAVVYTGEVMVIGGATGVYLHVPTDKVSRLDREKKEWVNMPPLKTARYGHQAVVMNGQIMVMGGMDQQDNALRSVEVFDGEKWTYAHDMDTAIKAFTALVI